MLIIKFEISVSSKEAEVSVVVTDFTHSIFSLVSFCTLVAVNDSPSFLLQNVVGVLWFRFRSQSQAAFFLECEC
jgi:hypothetical protein